jgi:AcrR family transcriptional regulator
MRVKEVGAGSRRRYDSPVRRAQTEDTRAKILAAGTALAREATLWDWRDLTVKAVAERAGISERTVYRHFATERQLHDAMMQQLEQDAGVRYEGLALKDIASVSARVFSSMADFSVPPAVVRDETFAASDQYRRDALLNAVREAGAGWSPAERRMAAAILDILWVPTSYERLVVAWGFDPANATHAVSWAIELILRAFRAGDRPGVSAAATSEPRVKRELTGAGSVRPGCPD